MPAVPVALGLTTAAVIWIHFHVLHFAVSCLTLTLRKTIQRPVWPVHYCAKLQFTLLRVYSKRFPWKHLNRPTFFLLLPCIKHNILICGAHYNLYPPQCSPQSDLPCRSTCKCYFSGRCQRRKSASSWAFFHVSVISEAWGVKIKVLKTYQIYFSTC